MFRRILIALDGGEPARRAVDVAVQLAGELDGKLAAIHVVDSLQAPSELTINDAEVMADLRLRGEEILDVGCARVPPSVPVERFLFVGDPAESILSTATEWHADVIVIGSDSRGRLAHFLLGSTADSVIRKAPCPVITVRAAAAVDAERRPFSAAT
jgi:nucleotide-binding universal stress UspA family protein